MITLYTTDCPRCRVIESKLKSKNISFEINKDVNKMLELGIQSAPALDINGQLLKFKEANDWINKQEEQK